MLYNHLKRPSDCISIDNSSAPVNLYSRPILPDFWSESSMDWQKKGPPPARYAPGRSGGGRPLQYTLFTLCLGYPRPRDSGRSSFPPEAGRPVALATCSRLSWPVWPLARLLPGIALRLTTDRCLSGHPGRADGQTIDLFVGQLPRPHAMLQVEHIPIDAGDVVDLEGVGEGHDLDRQPRRG